MKRTHRVALFSATTYLVLCFQVFAQTGETGVDLALEEIVVSGLRRQANDELATSLTRLDSATLNEATVQHFEELTHLVPNLNWAGGVSRPRYFQIRGIGERSQYEGAPNPSVGFIIDDLDFSAIGGIATLFDTRQVEVLRGPQGTRYGANALAGLIYVKYQDPTPEFDARFSATGGSDDSRAIGMAIGGPLSNTLSYRAVAHQYQSNGFRDNPFLGRDDTNGRDELTTRLKLRYAPNDRWQFDLTAMHVALDNGYDAFAVDNSFTTQSDRPGEDSQRTDGLVLSVEGDVSDAFSLVSITGAARSDIVFGFDADWGNPAFWAPVVYDFFSTTDRDRENLSQELRLVSTPGAGWFGDRVDWVAGALVSRLQESNFTRDDGNYEGAAFAASILREYEATSSAVFVDLTWSLTDTLELNGGIRAEQRESEYADSAGDRFDPDESSVGGQLALRYAIDENTSAYAKVARGFKAGGFNLGLPAEADNEVLLFDAEYLWNYELGLHGRWLEDRLDVDVSLFWMQRRDQQVQTSTQLDPGNPATFVFFTENAGKGRNRGLEIALDYAPSESLSLFGSAGLLDTQIRAFGDSPQLVGRDQAHAPRWSYSLGTRLDFSRDWFARLDVTGRDAFYFSDSHDQRSEKTTLVNARIGIDRDNWSLTAWGRNLFDERYAVRGFFFGNEPARNFADTLYVRQGDPRHYGVTFEYRTGR